jgi:mRNA interferase MazF
LDIKGLPKKSWLEISQVRTLSTRRIGERPSRVWPEVLDRAIEGLKEIIS